jgi:CHAT domain-containing protein
MTKLWSASGCILAALLIGSGCAVEQPSRFETTSASTRRALQRGEIKEALAFHESKARQAEQEAGASSSPQPLWESAMVHYKEAARAARLSGQVQKMLAYSEKTSETAQKTGKTTLQVNAINEMIEAYQYLKNFGKVRELITQGLVLVNLLPPNTSVKPFWEGTLYYQMGADLIRRKEYESAIDVLSHSVNSNQIYLRYVQGVSSASQTQREIGRVNLLLSLTRLGNAYLVAGQLQRAREQYESAFNFIRVWGFEYVYEGDLYRNIGDIYLQQRMFTNALENFQKALVLAETQRRSSAITETNRRIGFVLLQSGKPADALPYYRNAIQQIESARSLLQAEDSRQSFFEGSLAPYRNILEALLALEKPVEAFDYSERARARTFLDVLSRKAQLSRAKSGLLEAEKTLQERIAAIRARLSGEGDEGTNRAGLEKELAAAEQAYNSFLAKVRSQDKEQASLMSVEPLTLKQVQELIDPAQTLIEYFVTDNEVLVWVVEKDKLNFQRIALSKNALIKQVKTLREMISTLGDTLEMSEVSSSLYKSLIQPLLPHITGKELIIVPHDVLHYLPFQALIDADGRYLIEKYPINYLSSASLLQFTKEKSRAMGEKVLVLGNPDLGDRKMNLEFAEIEAKEIKNLYPQSTIFLEKEATEEKAKALSPNNDIIHFASHAELNEDDPLASAIRLAKSDKEDGRLEVREIFGMDLKASLVVLSACETGLGKLSSGDELVGLTRAFIYAGTPSVVASLWNVEDSSTAQLMASFYKNLKTMTKVEALRQAQLNLIRGNVNSDLLARRGIGGIGRLGEVPGPKSPSPDSISISTSHPFFWAPFILVGEGK